MCQAGNMSHGPEVSENSGASGGGASCLVWTVWRWEGRGWGRPGKNLIWLRVRMLPAGTEDSSPLPEPGTNKIGWEP